MNDPVNRHARKNARSALPRRRRTRCAVAVLVAATALTGLLPAAQAATGGASSAPTATTAAPEGELTYSPMRTGGASWYGPGLWGHKTACGQTLRPDTLGVAHRRLPCGTTVKFLYHGRTLVTQVIDRGPYVQGRTWDLTAAASETLGLEGVGNVRYAVAVEYARPGH